MDDFSSESESDSSSEEEEVAEEDTSEEEAEDLEEDYDDEDDDDLLDGADAPKTSKSFSTSGRQLKRYLAGCVLVPYRWSRRLTEDLDDRGPLVYYCSPSGSISPCWIFLSITFPFQAASSEASTRWPTT